MPKLEWLSWSQISVEAFWNCTRILNVKLILELLDIHQTVMGPAVCKRNREPLTKVALHITLAKVRRQGCEMDLPYWNGWECKVGLARLEFTSVTLCRPVISALPAWKWWNKGLWSCSYSFQKHSTAESVTSEQMQRAICSLRKQSDIVLGIDAGFRFWSISW